MTSVIERCIGKIDGFTEAHISKYFHHINIEASEREEFEKRLKDKVYQKK